MCTFYRYQSWTELVGGTFGLKWFIFLRRSRIHISFQSKWIIPVLSWFKFWKLNIVMKMLLLNICCSVTLYNNQIQYSKQYTQDLSLVVFINTRHYIHRFLLKFLKLSRIRQVKCSSYWLYHCYCCCSNECIRNETFD